MRSIQPERSSQDLRALAKRARKLARDRKSDLSYSDRKELIRLAFDFEKIATLKARSLAHGRHPEHSTRQ